MSSLHSTSDKNMFRFYPEGVFPKKKRTKRNNPMISISYPQKKALQNSLFVTGVFRRNLPSLLICYGCNGFESGNRGQVKKILLVICYNHTGLSHLIWT